MKILAIRLENLASLAGRHELDFTREPLADQGLFAITGPTGAGKSTLLDALCLALYGSTPRLRLAPSRDSQLPDAGGEALTTADARTLLRRGCAAGFAEVDFVGRDLRRYRARWAVRRARGRPEGRLQAAEQSLTDLDDQRLLTAQKREFDRLLPGRLGLSFEQFTRAVLLAQSEFAAFLKADDNARSELLEKLTDTGEYSRISIVAYRRARDAQQGVRELEQQLAGEAPAETEERARLVSEAANCERELADVTAQSTRLQGQRQWLQQDQRLAQAMHEAQQRRDQARRDNGSLAALREREDQLEQLAPQRHRFLRRNALAPQCREHEQALATTRQALGAAEREQAHAAHARQQADMALVEATRARDDSQPMIEAARELTTQLEHHQRTWHDKQTSHQRVAEALAADRQRRDEMHGAHRRQQSELQALEAALRDQLGEHADALTARRALQASEDQAAQRRLALQSADQRWQQWRESERQLDELRRRQQDEQREQEDVLAQGQTAAAELDRLGQEQQQLQDSIERLRAARSDSVARLRQQLDADHPCPVCGSHEHPYRDAPPAEPAQAMLAATEQEEQRQLNHATQAVDTARERHHTLQGQYRALQARLTQGEAQLTRLADNTATQRARLLEQPDGQTLFDQGLLDRGEIAAKWLGEQRECAERQWQQCRKALEALEATQQRLAPLREALQQHDVEFARLASRCEQHAQALAGLDTELAPLAERCQRLTGELRQTLDNHPSPKAWQAALDTQLERTRHHAQQAQRREQQASNTLQGHQQTLGHQQQALATLRQEQAELTRELDAWRKAHTQLDDATLERLLSVDEDERQTQRQRLQEAERELHAAEVSLTERHEALLAHRRERFRESEAGSPLAPAIEARIAELRERLASEEAALTERSRTAQQQRDQAQHALHDDDRRRERKRDLLAELERARHEQQRWGSISALIGSADGKAFRRIAQAYNLEQLLEHGNAHLVSLSRRYRLTRGGSELGIVVIDGDMGDERRSVHSLSGGETFLVSLALALGLASMASGQLRIESLFIDEGFGSLDPQSLALAMEALDGLQAQGRRVGVISHIQEMHERIPLQISIEPQGNGASRLNIVNALMP